MPLIVAAVVWFLVPELALRLVLIAMIVLVLPSPGRRSPGPPFLTRLFSLIGVSRDPDAAARG
nr:hypothetical protein GCM10020092_085520 [Actinoplanes digitatis]